MENKDNNNVGLHIIEPPKEIFVHKTTDRTFDIKREGSPQPICTHIECTNEGILVYNEEALFPEKGFVFPDAMWECNIVKRVLVEYSKLSFWNFITKKGRQKLVDSFNQIADKVMKFSLIEERFLSPIAKELQYIITQLLIGVKITPQSAEQCALYISHLIQYDNAYRYRLEDMFSETSKEQLLESPIIELDRILLILESRDTEGVSRKFRKIGTIIMGLICIPSYFHLFRDIISKSKFERLQYDEADRYWVTMRNDYKYLGEDYETRKKRFPRIPMTIMK